ncbi:hypothetical protein P6709_20430, partial [Jeotgalibacillus sp. ET6]|uniref:hypothetical protein n=1 Tax=Jeotgalibacillus sp. ET6 TaxID=3037260 RepID=UPI002418A6BC
ALTGDKSGVFSKSSDKFSAEDFLTRLESVMVYTLLLVSPITAAIGMASLKSSYLLPSRAC